MPANPGDARAASGCRGFLGIGVVDAPCRITSLLHWPDQPRASFDVRGGPEWGGRRLSRSSGSAEAWLDGVGGWVFTRGIEHTFENRVILMMQEVLL